MKPKTRILMLEDSPDDAELLRRELRRGGISFDARRVDTRATFLEQLEEFKPDIIISDYSLPSFNGLDALRLLRDRSFLRPFILVSGHIGEEGAIEALKLGATDFILKESSHRLGPCVLRALREADDRAEYGRLEQRFRVLFESAPHAMVMINVDGRIEMLNKQTEQMFGYSRAELLGQPMNMLVPERIRAPDRVSRSTLFLTTRPLPVGTESDLFGLTRDSREFPIDIGLNPIETEDGSMVLAVIMDVTERRQVEMEKDKQRHDLERLNGELKRSNADLEAFAYVASHDLKAPLRAITSLAGWIREEIEATATPETLENLKLLEGRAARLQMLLDGLLAYSRIERSSFPLEDVDTVELVRDIAVSLAPPPGFLINCDGTMPRLRTHRPPIQTVLQNLIANGVKHHDRTEGRLTISARLVDELIEFRVSDDGPGIPSQFHERIFIIFQTLQSRDEFDSSGIGLAIVKKEIESHGGTIRVESAPPERGTTFVFTWRPAPP